VQVEYTVVAEGYRRRGVGRALMGAAACYAEDIGADQVTVSVSPMSREANRFYAQLGLTPLSVRRVAPASALRRRIATLEHTPSNPERATRRPLGTRTAMRTALRRLAMATSVGTIETSGGQEDVQSFGWEAAEVLRAAIRHARAVTVCELLTARQAIRLADRPAPPGCRPVLGWLDGLVEPILADRPFGTDIERIAAAPWPETP